MATRIGDGSVTITACPSGSSPRLVLVTADGDEPVATTLAAFLDDNAESDLDPDLVDMLWRGQPVVFGGGAGPEVRVVPFQRVAAAFLHAHLGAPRGPG